MPLLDFDDQPPVSVLIDAQPGQVDDQGVPLQGPILATSFGGGTGQITGRISSPSTKQLQAWKSLAVEINYVLYTREPGIKNGMYVQGSDGRLFRVIGTGGAWYPIGTFDQPYYSYPLVIPSAT